jgi:hypothetical protein
MAHNRILGISGTLLLLALPPCVTGQQQLPPSPPKADAETTTPAPSETPARVTKPPISALKVTCDGAQLSISANNSTLANILAEIHKCSGAKIDEPDDAAGSRLFDQLGPAPVGQVLDALLDATGFDYVIGWTDANHDKIASILVMHRQSGAASAAAVDDRNLSPIRRAYVQMRETARPKPPEEQQEQIDAATTAPDPEPAPADPTPAQQQDPAATNTPADPAATAAANAAQPATDAQPTSTDPPQPPATQPATQPNTQSGPPDPVTSLQQLIEQRRKMMETQTPPAPQ